MVGSSRKTAETIGEAPIMSPAETTALLGLVARNCAMAEESQAAPPAGTRTEPSSRRGASIDCLGGSRLPWKSLKAISLTSTGAAAERGPVVAQPPRTNAAAAATTLLCIDDFSL